MNQNVSPFKELKRLVNDYLTHTPMHSIGPREIYLKSLLLITSWTLTYLLLLFIGPMNPSLAALCLIPLLILTCALEFCIMHDASHKAYSRYPWLNKIALQLPLWILGGCSLSWHQEHVVRHHGHTNILGADPDVYASHVLRLHPNDQWHWWQRWQHYYAVPLYSLMWVHWVFNDLINAIFNTYKLSFFKLCLFWAQIFFGLIIHLTLGLLLPYLAFEDIWMVGICYSLFFMCVSFAMAITFVLAHVTHTHEFYTSAKETNDDWAIHQLETTTDFAVDNRFLTWLLGGLNFQVEHHIFPTICHLHYPAIQKIVKNYCQMNGLIYHEEKTVWEAVASHLKHLKALAIPPKIIQETAMALLHK